MSLLLASKYVVPSHIRSEDFSGFRIISISKLVNVTCEDERAFNQKFKTLSIPSDFHFWDLVKFKYGYVFPFLFFYFLIFFLRIPYPAPRHITGFFFSPYPFPELLCTTLRWCFFYHNLVSHFLVLP